MREKRKRNAASIAKGLSAGEKLNRNRLLAECDLRWNWIGTEAKHISEITREHRLRAAGLALLGSKRPCSNKFIKKVRSHPPLRQPALSSEDPEDVIVISDGEEDSLCDKKRCKDNPYCLNYLGQEKWEDEEKAEEAYLRLHLKDEDPRSYSRGAMPVGLKNLGATCYANAFLQVWFQDLAFRSGVYRCQPSPTNKFKFKDSPIFQLQATFTALQEGHQSVFNPIKLVESLRLRTTEQQDAQEFSKLFMSHLDDEFKKQSNPELQSLLPDQFEGKMVNATVCDNCKTRSERETTFLELEVNLEKNGILEDRIASVLAPERLDDNNKYLCSVCESLQDATRYTEIRSLPPVLHISLLRFVYDLTTYERKKSKLPLKFPPYLNMKPFLQSADPHHMLCDDENDSEMYELRGVLLHKGPSAYHGHYEAQVYNQQAKKWYQFNDEVVTPLSSFHSAKSMPSINSEAVIIDGDDNDGRPVKRRKRAAISRRVDDSDDGQNEQATSTRITTGTKVLCSKDAYMLIYARREDPKLTNARPLTPPPDALEIIRLSNEAHEAACVQYDAMREEKRAEFVRTRDAMRDLYLSWHVSSASEPSIIVSKTAIEKWLLSPLTQLDLKKGERLEAAGPAEGKPEGKESNGSVSDVEIGFLDKLTKTNDPPSSTVRTIDSTNLLCPSDLNGHERQLYPLFDKDMKVISRVARDKIVNSGFTFMPEFTVDSVCKYCAENEFLEKLYQLEHPQLVAKFNDICKTETENEGFWISKAWLKDWQLNKPRMHNPSQPDLSPDNISDEQADNFYSHVYCKHDNLSINVATRRRITFEAVQLLRRLFKDWNPPPWDAETCPTCDVDVHMSKEAKLGQRKIAENEKAHFYRLNNENIFGQQGVSPDSTYAVIPSEFIHRWRKWLIKPGDSLRPTAIVTQSILCEHGNLNLDLSDEADFDNDLAVLTIAEWEHLQTLYTCGPLIKVRCVTELDESGHHRKRVTGELPCCLDCRTKEKLSFKSTLLTVIRLDRGPAPTTASSPLIDGHDAKASTSVANGKNGIFPAGFNAPSNGKMNGTRQSRRLQEGKNSSRQQIQVQKQWTIKDVKIAIYKVFKIPTISQRLFYHGKELDENSKTVADLEILNKDTLYLREAIEDAIVLDSDVEDEAELREGAKKRVEGDAFRGTLLSGGRSSSPPNELVDQPMSSRSSSPFQKPCSACTLLNPFDAAQCEACEAFL